MRLVPLMRCLDNEMIEHSKLRGKRFDLDEEIPELAADIQSRLTWPAAHTASFSLKIFELCRMSTGNPG